MKADGLTIMQLAKATPPYVRSRAQTAVIKKLKSTKTKNGFLAIQAVAVDTFNDRPRPHKCFIISRDHKAGDGHRMYEKGNRVLVSCACEFFTFTCEYALTQWGASRIIHSNGEPATTTNPANHPLLCIAKGQLVHTKRGLVPIEDVQVGDVVQSHSGWNAVTAAAKTGVRETVRLQTQFGRNVRCTPDHKVLAVRGGHFGWYEAGTLSVGDWIVSKPGAFDSTVASNADLAAYARLLGYYTAEGCGSTFSQPAEFDNVRKDFFETCTKLGYAAEFIPRTTAQNRGIQIPADLMSRFYADGFVQDSYSRRVPKYLFQASYSEVVEFLRGLYAGDGYVTERVSTLGSASKKLLRDVQQLLTALRISTGLYYNKNSGANRIDMWLLRTTNVRSTQKLIALLDPIRKHKISGAATARVTKYIPFDVRKQLLRYERQALRKRFAPYSAEADQRVLDLFTRFGIGDDSLKRAMFTRGISYEYRDRVGGKPSHYVSTGAFIDFTFEKLLRRHAKDARLIFGKGSSSCGVSLLEKYLSKVDFGCLSRKSRRLLNLILDPSVGFEKVVAVKEAKPTAVYDLTIENAHSFVVDGLVVHNCKHLFALTKELKTKGM